MWSQLDRLLLNPHFRAPVCLDLNIFIMQETPRPGASSAPAAKSQFHCFQASSWQIPFEANKSMSRIASYRHTYIQASDLNTIFGKVF